ncbi:MAG: TolC family protein [Bacteroidota bacterium]
MKQNRINKLKGKWKVFCLLIFFPGFGFAQSDSSFALSYADGKKILLKQSLSVLAEYYNINLAEAEVEQAKLWNNPLFVWNAEMYSVDQNRYFKFVNQKLIQVEYVISASGKRIKAVREASIAVDLSKSAFEDVVRGLIYEYSEAFTELWALNKKNEVYKIVLEQYEYMQRLFRKQYELGAISLNDLIRVESEIVSIQTEVTANKNEILSQKSKLNTLLNLGPQADVEPVERKVAEKDTMNIGGLMDLALAVRPDWKIAQRNIDYYQAQLKTQKAEAMPDINLGYQPHDKGSNHVRPYIGMVLEVGLPIFNRNQGNISKANIMIEQSKLEMQLIRKSIENEVFSAYFMYKNYRENFSLFSEKFVKDVEGLSENARRNFEKKNISLLEFIDYQRTFLDVRMKNIEQYKNYYHAVNALNFVTGKEVTN